MKKIFARISMELLVSDEEAKKIFEDCHVNFYCDSATGITCNNEFDIPDELAKKILKKGTYAEGSSYVPEDCISEVKEKE